MYTGEKCSVCGKDATHKIGEEFGVMDQRRLLHNLTNYVCDYHFNMVICPKDNPINQSKKDAIEFAEWMRIRTKEIKPLLYKYWDWDDLQSPAKTRDGLFSLEQLYNLFTEFKHQNNL